MSTYLITNGQKKVACSPFWSNYFSPKKSSNFNFGKSKKFQLKLLNANHTENLPFFGLRKHAVLTISEIVFITLHQKFEKHVSRVTVHIQNNFGETYASTWHHSIATTATAKLLFQIWNHNNNYFKILAIFWELKLRLEKSPTII